jgi:hypothetical protein
MTVVLVVSAVIAGGSISGIATTATSPQVGSLEQGSFQGNPQPQAQVSDVTAPNCEEVSYDGEGTSSDPYLIRSVDQLQCIDNDERGGPGLDDNYRLTTDLNAEGTAVWNDGDGFAPIAQFGDEFDGTLDGDNHTISGLNIERAAGFDVGLFGRISSTAEIEDLTLRDVSVTGDNDVGAVVGENEGKATNVSVSGSVTGDFRVGGIVGFNNDGTLTISNASVTVTSEGNYIGGLVGRNDGDIRQAYLTGKISGDKREVLPEITTTKEQSRSHTQRDPSAATARWVDLLVSAMGPCSIHTGMSMRVDRSFLPDLGQKG